MKIQFRKVVEWEGKPWFALECFLLLGAVIVLIVTPKDNWYFWVSFVVALIAVAGMEGNITSRKVHWEKIKQLSVRE